MGLLIDFVLEIAIQTFLNKKTGVLWLSKGLHENEPCGFVTDTIIKMIIKRQLFIFTSSKLFFVAELWTFNLR